MLVEYLMSKVYSRLFQHCSVLSTSWVVLLKALSEALDCQRLVFEALSGWQGRGRDGHLFRQSLKSFHCPRLLMNDCFLCGAGSGPVFVFCRGRLRATWDVLWRFNSFSYVVDGVLLVLVLKNSRLLKWCRLSYLDHISWSYFSRGFL